MLCALQVLAQDLVHPDLQPPEQDEHPEESPPERYGSSILQEVISDGIAIAATMGNATVAAFLKKERLSIIFFFIVTML